MTPFKNWAKNLLFLLVYIFSGLALVIIIDGLSTGTELTPFNTTIEAAILHIRTPYLTSFFLWVTNVGNPVFLIIASIFLAIVLLLHRDTYDALLYIVSMIFALASYFILQNTFHFSRPGAALVGISGWSFPSGHATMSVAFFFTTAYAFLDWFKTPQGKAALITGCVVGACLICFSRIYLGAHWSLDILAGIALGFLCVSFVALIFNIFLEEESFRKRKRLI